MADEDGEDTRLFTDIILTTNTNMVQVRSGRLEDFKVYIDDTIRYCLGGVNNGYPTMITYQYCPAYCMNYCFYYPSTCSSSILILKHVAKDRNNVSLENNLVLVCLERFLSVI